MEFKSEVSVYTQIMDYLKKEIFCGVFDAAQKVPPIRELAVMLKVNHNTVVRAYAELEAEGFIVTNGTSGKFVTEDREFLEEKKREFISKSVGELVTDAIHVGISKSEIIKMVEDKYGK